MTDLRATLVQLRRRVDEHFDAALARTPSGFACREGCWSCCRPRFSVFEIEALGIREALAELDPELRERVREQGRDAELGHCALLVEGRCSVYAQRPVICRSHGLAVMTDEGVVDHCELNYVGVEVPRASVLVLEAVNRPLGVMAQMWAAGERVGLDALARGE
ncbi:YkgJ family cysteine cluster protein [Nannocystaceae bacterium ST9]